jgi:nitrogen-specific signal transduction histidine kinase
MPLQWRLQVLEAGLTQRLGRPVQIVERDLFGLTGGARDRVLDAMTAGGSLTIDASASAERVRIEISDTGTGIDADLLPRIFQPWVTTKPAGRGTGLGLSITQDVIARHGGTIHAVSDPGRRTTFTIELPIPEAAERHHAQDSDC